MLKVGLKITGKESRSRPFISYLSLASLLFRFIAGYKKQVLLQNPDSGCLYYLFASFSVNEFLIFGL
jgi:hypothetical protein